MNMNHENEKYVPRSISFPLSAFDYLKDFQRAYETKHGVRINNNQAIAIIFGEHQQLTGLRGVRRERTSY